MKYALILYLPLLLKTLSSFRLFNFSEKSIYTIGKFEAAISPIRDWKWFYILFILWFLLHGQIGFFFFTTILGTATWLNRRSQQFFKIKLCHSLLHSDEVDPQLFFNLYYQGWGSFMLPDFDLLKSSAPKEDYRTGKPYQSTLFPMIRGALRTMVLARLAICAMEHFNRTEGRDIFDQLARLWGSMYLEVAKGKIETIIDPSVQNLSGHVLLVFNHKSYLDFVLNFFALRHLQVNGRKLRPRFIAARDHFIENYFIHSLLGVGKCIEKAGMIFVNRRKGQGWLAMKEASEHLLNSDIEIAVYPQGTRALPWLNEKGERQDAGYYSTFSRSSWAKPLGHLKIGTAQLILDTSLALAKKGAGPLNVVFVGISGSATMGPRKSFWNQTETTVSFNVNKIWQFSPLPHLTYENPGGELPKTEAHHHYFELLQSIQVTLDHEIAQSIQHHCTLVDLFTQRADLFRDDVEKEKSKLLLERKDAVEHKLPFVILDRIYSLPVSETKTFLKQFKKCLLEEASAADWEALNQQVSLALIQ